MTDHTESDVIEAYRKKLRLAVRQMKIEQTREETLKEREERIDAHAEFIGMELQYIAQFT
jgi:hypothetical protein